MWFFIFHLFENYGTHPGSVLSLNFVVSIFFFFVTFADFLFFSFLCFLPNSEIRALLDLQHRLREEEIRLNKVKELIGGK